MHEIKQRLESLIDHYVPFCLALALVIFSLLGVGDVYIVSLSGILLCVVGMVQKSAQVDLWILIPLIFYDLVAMVSSYMVYGNIMTGYGVLHAIFPVIYLLISCLNKEDLCLLRHCCDFWVGCVAGIGIGQFVFRAIVQGRAGRMGGLLGNPNAMGIFLVIGWFALMHSTEEQNEDRFLPHLEPILLIALTLTLSMGSFLAMAVGIGVLLIVKKRNMPWGETFWYACRLLARIVFGMGVGLLVYLAAARTRVAGSCLFLLVYGIAVVVCWKTFKRFLEIYRQVAFVISVFGIFVVAAVIAVRPSAVSTFAERIEMMGSGLSYLRVSPLFGVGPFQWRLLDLEDGGKYFNTWHIHNIPIHIGVEMGWIAMAMVILVGLRTICKKKTPSLKAGMVAFLFHNLIDTSFFYLGITALMLEAVSDPKIGGKKAGSVVIKILFALFIGLFAGSMLFYAIW